MPKTAPVEDSKPHYRTSTRTGIRESAEEVQKVQYKAGMAEQLLEKFSRVRIFSWSCAPDSANPPKRYRKSSEAEDPETAPLPAAGTDTMPADQRGDGPGSARVAAGVRSVHRPVARSSMKRSLRLPARGGQGRGHASFAARRLPSPLAAPSSSDPPKT